MTSCGFLRIISRVRAAGRSQSEGLTRRLGRRALGGSVLESRARRQECRSSRKETAMPLVRAIVTVMLIAVAPLQAFAQGSAPAALDAIAKALGATTVT